MSQKPFITLDDITVRLGGRWLLKGLSWQINAGENGIVWGPNGAGKTTLAKTLLDQVAVVQGHIYRHYKDDTRNNPNTHSIALISSEQHTHFYLQEQLLEEMSHFSGNRDLTTMAGKVFESMAGENQPFRDMVVRRLGLEPILSKPVKVLSAGEVRKLLIGRALMLQPRMLILDEPFNGLDRLFQERLMGILNQLDADGVQMVLVTHRPEEIPACITHRLHIEAGRVLGTHHF